MVEVKVRGLPELRKALQGLPFRLQQNALRIAVQEAAKLFAAEVEAATPIWGGYMSPKRATERPRGYLRDSVKARRRRAKRLQVRSTVDMTWYGRLLEKGWNLTEHDPGKKVIRRIRAHPFIRPAFDRARDRAVKLIEDVIRRELVNQPLKAQARARTKLVKAVSGMFDSGGE